METLYSHTKKSQYNLILIAVKLSVESFGINREFEKIFIHHKLSENSVEKTRPNFTKQLSNTV